MKSVRRRDRDRAADTSGRLRDAHVDALSQLSAGRSAGELVLEARVGRAAERVLIDCRGTSALAGNLGQVVVVVERTAEVHDPEHHHEEWERNERELDDGGAALASPEPGENTARETGTRRLPHRARRLAR